MVVVKLTDDRSVVINQRHITSFCAKKTEDNRKFTEIKMSNGDTFQVTEPSYEAWEEDAFTDKPYVY